MLCPIACRFETCPYDHGNVAQNGRHIFGRGFYPCFVDDARDGNPEGVEQNGDIIKWKKTTVGMEIPTVANS
jgi:hypothetical protein